MDRVVLPMAPRVSKALRSRLRRPCGGRSAGQALSRSPVGVVGRRGAPRGSIHLYLYVCILMYMCVYREMCIYIYAYTHYCLFTLVYAVSETSHPQIHQEYVPLEAESFNICGFWSHALLEIWISWTSGHATVSMRNVA